MASNKIYILWEYYSNNQMYEDSYDSETMLGVFFDKQKAIDLFEKTFSERTKNAVKKFPKEFEEDKSYVVISKDKCMHMFYDKQFEFDDFKRKGIKLGEYLSKDDDYMPSETYAFFLEEVTPMDVHEDTQIINDLKATGSVLDARDPNVKKFLETPAVPYENKSGIKIEIK